MTVCEPDRPGPPVTANPPGQPTLRRRVAVHSASLARMRAVLAAEAALPLRALARHDTEDPAIALLDAWALVADVVAFYSERIADEGFLRTASELRSVRQLARTIGYELRPGVAAEAEVVFSVETAAGSPAVVAVDAGTPVQSVPGPGELPQIFETAAPLEARAVWNEIPAIAAEPQVLPFDESHLWLRSPAPGAVAVRAGDPVLVVGAERLEYREPRKGRRRRLEGPAPDAPDERWEFRTVVAVVPEPDGLAGWTRLDLDRGVGYLAGRPLMAERDVRVYRFTERANVFGWNAPDPALLAPEDRPLPPGIVIVGGVKRWRGFALKDEARIVELDGDHPRVLPGSWLVLERPDYTELYRAERVVPDGDARFGVAGRITRVRVDIEENLSTFTRRRTVVHCAPEPLPASLRPTDTPVTGGSVRLPLTDPPLPAGRLIAVGGTDLRGLPASEVTRVLACAPDRATATMHITVDPPLSTRYAARTVRVRANVATATHGETVRQVLAGGDAQTPFAEFAPRRTPLTWLRDTTAGGARPELGLRVDGGAWTRVADLAEAGPDDRVYVLRCEEDGAVRVVVGDGVHGARLPTGQENVEATYRVGVGAAGALPAGRLTLMPRRPQGIREVTNPLDTHDWAPPEDLDAARVAAPQRIRTLDRVVSLADHQDFALAYAGVGPARADRVWDGRQAVVVLSVLGFGGNPPGRGLLDDLRAAVDAARDPGWPVLVLPAEFRWFGIRVEVQTDPAFRRPDVLAAVQNALAAALGADTHPLATPVTAAATLLVVRRVPGVSACTIPRLLALPDPPSDKQAVHLPPDSAAADPLRAEPGRFSDGIRAAEHLALVPGAVEVGEMR